MNEQEFGLPNHPTPEKSPDTEIICANVTRFFNDIQTVRSYDSVLMSLSNYVDNEYGADVGFSNQFLLDGLSHELFPTEADYESDRSMANDKLYTFLYDYLGKAYEDSHDVHDASIWMVRVMAKIKEKTGGRHNQSSCMQPAYEPYRQCLSGPCPVNYIAADIAKEASTLIEASGLEDHKLIDERYVKLRRRLVLAYRNDYIDKSDYCRVLSEANRQFDSLVPYVNDSTLASKRIPDL